jgi:hypothetical protein
MAIEFLTVEGANPIEIHRRLRSVNGEDAIDVSSVGRWVSLFKKSEKTYVTGPTAADQPQQRQRRPERGFM